MNMKKIFLSLAALLVMAACHQGATSQAAAADQAAMARDSAARIAADFKKTVISLVDYKKDPACGMPLTAGLEDTTRYKGKLYGFCSKECKEEFLKNPDGYSAKAK
jgi:YHS domain-containing protein